MPFDLQSAKPVGAPASMARGFDLTSATPVTEADAAENPLLRFAKVHGSAAVRGVLGLPALAMDLMTMTTNESDNLLPNTTAVQGLLTQPKTEGEKWGAAITQGAVGGVAGPGGLTAPVKLATAGATGAVGAETAAHLLGEGPLQRLLGGVVGGVGGAAMVSRIGRAAPQVEELARQVLKGISPEMLLKAQEFQRQASLNGVAMDLAQALHATGAPANNVNRLRDVLADSQHGTQVQAFLRAQPNQLRNLADTTVAGMPGEVRQGDVAANNLQQAATDRVQQAKDARTVIWETTLEDTKRALQDTARLKIAQAQAPLPGLQINVGQARARLQQLQADLAAAKAGDEAAVAAANKKVEEARALVEKLATFTLPRGRATGNTGRYFELPQRGQSIDFDEIARSTQATRLQAEIPPKVQPAPSLATTNAEKALLQGKLQAGVAEGQLVQGQEALSAAQGELQNISRVPPETGKQVVSNLMRLASSYPDTAQGRAMGELARKLMKADGTPKTDPTQINQVLKEAAAKLKDPDLAAKGVDAGTAKWIGGQINATREAYGAAFEPLRQANAAYRTATAESVNPLRQGLVGDIAGRGAKPDVAAKQDKFMQLLDRGEDPIATGKSNIYQLGKELGKVADGGESFADALKTYVSRKVGEAFPADLPNSPAAEASSISKVYDSLFRSRNQFEGLRQATAASAELMGKDPAKVVRGLENFAQITRALTNTKSPAGLRLRDVYETSSRNPASTGLRFFGIAPFAGPARRIEDFVNRRTFETFDQLLTTPDGADKLIELSKHPVMSAKALAAYASRTAGAQGTGKGLSNLENLPGIIPQ